VQTMPPREKTGAPADVARATSTFDGFTVCWSHIDTQSSTNEFRLAGICNPATRDLTRDKWAIQFSHKTIHQIHGNPSQHARLVKWVP